MLTTRFGSVARHLSSIAACGAILLSAGCGFDVTSPDAGDDAMFTARWGGAAWLADAGATIRPGGAAGDTLYVFASSPPGAGQMAAEALTIWVLFDGVGSYPLDSASIRLWQLTGGDVITATYAGRGTDAGMMTITKYDSEAGVLEGTVRFEAASSSEYASHGTDASFEDGKFRVSLPVLH